MTKLEPPVTGWHISLRISSVPSQTCTILFKKTYEYIFITPILFTLILMFIYLSNDGNIPSVFFIGFHPGGVAQPHLLIYWEISEGSTLN